MNKLRYYIVDVFAQAKYEGNQLAVFTGAGGLSSDEMQSIAKEMNYSETTFILSDEPQSGGFDVRIFTPGEEVPFAGHPTLGTSYVIRRFVLEQEIRQVVLNLKVGPIPVTFGEDGLQWMRQNEPEFGQTFEHKRLADVLGLTLDDMDTRYPVQIVSTGLPSLLVPLRGLDAVKRSRTQREPYEALIAETGTMTLMVFSPETYRPENRLNARSYCDCVGVPEDPATGSAAGNLSGYLVKHRYFGGPSIDLRMEQGYEIGRPSLLYLKASEQPDGVITVQVGGKTVPVAKGEWLP